jgi:hypothetical protein
LPHHLAGVVLHAVSDDEYLDRYGARALGERTPDRAAEKRGVPVSRNQDGRVGHERAPIREWTSRRDYDVARTGTR